MTNVYDNRIPSSPGPGVRFPPPLIYLAGLAAGRGIESLKPSPTAPGWLRVAAGASGAAALLALDTTSMVRFSRAGTSFNPARPDSALVTDGAYRFTRNPMYLGMAAAYAGGAVATGLNWALPLLPAVLLVIDRAVIPREERSLSATFGEEYERYKQRVRRWL